MGKAGRAWLLGLALASGAGADPTGIAHGRIRFSLAGDWTTRVEGDLLQGSLAGVPDGGMLVLAAKDLGGRTLAEAFTLGVDASTRGRTLLKANPPEPAGGSSRSGVPFVGQSRITKGAAGDVWMGLYYAFDVGGGAFQLLTFVAGTPATFKTLASASGAGLESLEVEAPPAPARVAVPAVSLGGPVGEAGSVYQQTGSRRDEYVSGVFSAQSARLEPVPFTLGYVRRYEFLATPEIGRSGDGRVYVLSPSTSALVDSQRFLMELPAKGPIGKTGFGLASLAPALDGQTDYQKTELMTFGRTDVMADGTVFFEVTPYGSKHVGYLAARPGGRVEVVAGPRFLAGFGNKEGWGSTTSLAACPDGRSAWLLLSNDGPAQLGYLTADGAGGWRARRVQASFGGKPITLSRSAMAWGAADPRGGYIWHEKDAFYRIAPDGTVIQLLQMPLPKEGVELSMPVVLPNGDLWIGIATEYWTGGRGTMDPSGAYTNRSTTFMVGDRSRLVRVRIDGQGHVALGEIGAEAVLAALRQAGGASDSGVFKPARLRIDHSTGGLLVFDTHHSALFSLLPGD